MGDTRMLRSHVERCLQDIWDQHHLVMDDDGDYPYRWGTAACWVRIESGGTDMVRVFAHAASDVKRSLRLLAELNELNASARSAQVYWVNGSVLVSHGLHAAAVDREPLGHACTSVGVVADDIGGMVAAVFGGSTPFPLVEEPAGEEPR